MNLELFPGPLQRTPQLRSGILSDRLIRNLVDQGALPARTPICDDQVQPASLDLRLGEVGYEISGSILPGPTSIEEQLARVRIRSFRLDHPTVLHKGTSYLIPTVESLCLPSNISARANPKSTTGRLDIVVRLLGDYAPEVDRFAKGYRGALFVEVTPRSFNIIVRAGSRLTQLRFLKGAVRPSDAGLRRLSERSTLVFHGSGGVRAPLIGRGLHVSLNLQAPSHTSVVGLRALPNPEPIDFDIRDAYAPHLFWAPVEPEVDGAVLIQANQFYLFSSLERVALPADHAAIMVPRNSIIGEFLFHYAGFFDPGYGTPRGAPFGLAIRSRWSSFYLHQGQVVARLIYEPLLESSQRIYGSEVNSSYDARPFPIAKQFRTAPLFS